MDRSLIATVRCSYCIVEHLLARLAALRGALKVSPGLGSESARKQLFVNG